MQRVLASWLHIPSYCTSGILPFTLIVALSSVALGAHWNGESSFKSTRKIAVFPNTTVAGSAQFWGKAFVALAPRWGSWKALIIFMVLRIGPFYRSCWL